MAEKKIMYISFCPMGDQCGKKSKRLQSSPTEEEARQAVQWHLERSSYHQLGSDEAKDMAMSADIEVEEWDVEPEEKDKADKTDKGWKADQWRSGPYQQSWSEPKGKGKGRGKQEWQVVPHTGGGQGCRPLCEASCNRLRRRGGEHP